MVRDNKNKGKKRAISFLFIFLMINIGFVFSAYAAVNAVTPSTNEQNMANSWAYVNQTSVGVGETTFEFVSTRAFLSCFEYRTDGDTSQVSGNPNYNDDVTDGLYPFVCVNNQVKNMTIEANEFVEVRMVFGAETDERFDWTRFDVETLPDLSHGTINLRYRSDIGVLEVWGESPVGAEGAELDISRVSDFGDIVYSDTAAILDDNDNPNRYAFNLAQGNEVDVSGFDLESYNVEVSFTGLPGNYKVSAIFNDLELEGVQADLLVLYNEVEDLWIVVDNNTEQIMYLWDDSKKQWKHIYKLEHSVHHLYKENKMQWFAIWELKKENDMQWKHIFILYNIAKYHEYKIDMLFKLLNDHNHGTINLMYSNEDAKFNPDTLRVWGEAPLGADYAKVMAFKQDGTLYKFAKVDVEDLLDNDNSYEHYFDTGDWDLESYNIVVMFYKELENGQVEVIRGFDSNFRYMHEWMAGYNVGDTFNELELEQIQGDLVILYNEVEDLWIAVDKNTQQIHYLWIDSKKQWKHIYKLEHSVHHLYKENKMQWFAIWELKKENDMQWKHIFILYNIAKYHEYKINMLFEMLEEHNHATINLGFYNEESNHDEDTLKVWGEAPLGADYARILIRYENGSDADYAQVPVITLDSNKNSYKKFFDVSELDKVSYNVVVKFYKELENGEVVAIRDLNNDFMYLHEWMAGYDVSGLFDNLHLQAIDDDITFLYNENDEQWIAILHNQNNITLIWNEIDGIWEEIDDINTLNARQTNFMLMSREMILELFELLETHNHATINLDYRDADSPYFPNTLGVWGEAPLGADYARIRIHYENMSVFTSQIVDVNLKEQNENGYVFHFDVEDWPAERFNVRVNFFDSDDNYLEGYDVGAVFDGLVIDQILEDVEFLYNENTNQWIVILLNQNNIALLWNEVDLIWEEIDFLSLENAEQWEAIDDINEVLEEHELMINQLFALLGIHNHGTINLDYRDVDSPFFPNTLGVWGEAPLGADYVRIRIHYQNMSVFESQITDVEEDNENGYVYHFDVTDWAAQTYNVRVNFFDSDDNYLEGYDVGAVFDGLLVDKLAEDISFLYNENTNQWIVILNNYDNISLLWNEVNQVWERVDLLELENAEQWEAIENINFVLDGHYDLIEGLLLFLNTHNHGTINLDYRDADSPFFPNTLGVWGEAPLGADYARIRIHYENMSVYTSQIVAVELKETNENGYVFHFNITDWPAQRFNVRVNFFDSEDNYLDGYDVGAVFDVLLLNYVVIDNLNQWDNITSLWEYIMSLQQQQLAMTSTFSSSRGGGGGGSGFSSFKAPAPVVEEEEEVIEDDVFEEVEENSTSGGSGNYTDSFNEENENSSSNDNLFGEFEENTETEENAEASTLEFSDMNDESIDEDSSVGLAGLITGNIPTFAGLLASIVILGSVLVFGLRK